MHGRFGEDGRGKKGVGCKEGGSRKMKMSVFFFPLLFFLSFWVADWVGGGCVAGSAFVFWFFFFLNLNLEDSGV